MVRVVVGATLSSLMVVVFVASALPALSTDQYATVWTPGPVTATGAVYVCTGPPSTV